MAELQAWNANNDQNDESAKIINWMIMEGEDRVARSPSSSSSSLSSSDLNNDYDVDDVRNGSCGSSNGPLYELSDLLLQLPIKRGLSKYYQGKSQSFRNLRKVENINDFAKKMSRKKTVRSNVIKSISYTSTPKAIIYKKSTSCFSYVRR